MENAKTIGGIPMRWVIIIAAFAIMATLVASGLVGDSDSGVALADTCRDQDLYEACLIAGNNKTDCKEAYCWSDAEFSSCAWYDIFCHWAGW